MAQNEQISILLGTKSDLTGINSLIGSVNSAGTALAATFGVGLSFGGLIALGREISAFAANIVNLANRLEISTDAFQHLANVARRNGVDVGQMQIGLSKLKASLDAASEGSPKLAAAFQTLGLDAKILAEAPLEDALRAIAVQIVSATDKTAALDAANSILGLRTMPRMLEMVRQLGSGYHDTADIIDKDYLERVRQATISTENFIVKFKNMGVLVFADALSIPRQLAGGDAATSLDARIKENEDAIKRYKKTLAELTSGDQSNPFYVLFSVKTVKNFEAGLAEATKRLSELRAEKAKADAEAAAPHKAGDPSDPAEALRIKSVAEAEYNLAVKKQEMSAEEDSAAQYRSIELQKDAVSNDVSRLQSQRILDRIALTGKEIAIEQKLAEALLEKRNAEQLGSPERKKLDREYDSQANKVVGLEKQQESDLRSARAAADREKASESLAAEIPLREKLADIEKERSLITQNQLLGSTQKQQKLNDNAEAYRQIIEKIVEIEKQRFASAKDSSEVARLKAEISRLQSSAREYSRRNDRPTREQQSQKAFDDLGQDTQHFQSPAGGLKAGLQDFATGMGTVADQIHGHVISIAQGLQSGIGNAMLGLEQRTMSWGSAFRSVANGLVTSLLTAGNQMIVAWVFGESARTAATTAGTGARVGILSGETAAHVAHNVIRFTIHAATEVGKTAVTILNAGIRIGSIIAESLAYVAQAAVGALSAMAWIPYVGPFLAIGAMAAILAAGYGIVKGVSKGFRKGGYTGDGPPDGEAGVVHFGEGVLHAGAMRLPGTFNAMASLNAGDTFGAMAALASATTGRLAARAGSPGAGGLAGAKAAASSKNMSVSFLDDRQAAIREMRKQSGQKQLIQMARNNRGQFFV